MTSSIFLPRRSFACPDPSTHLMESTMLVFPEPFGPTMAVTPPSKRISVGRANVLKPSRLSERRNKLGHAAGGPAERFGLQRSGWHLWSHVPLQGSRYGVHPEPGYNMWKSGLGELPELSAAPGRRWRLAPLCFEGGLPP